jgi:hypothetical protein
MISLCYWLALGTNKAAIESSLLHCETSIGQMESTPEFSPVTVRHGIIRIVPGNLNLDLAQELHREWR